VGAQDIVFHAGHDAQGLSELFHSPVVFGPDRADGVERPVDRPHRYRLAGNGEVFVKRAVTYKYCVTGRGGIDARL